MRLRLLPSLLFCILLPIVEAQAHHSFSAEFDNTPGELNGVITSVLYTNPHPRYRLLFTTEDGTTTEWELQGQSVTNLRATGWGRDFVHVGG